jgi:hypothetical protein
MCYKKPPGADGKVLCQANTNAFHADPLQSFVPPAVAEEAGENQSLDHGSTSGKAVTRTRMVA